MQRIYPLESLRGLAALIVAVFHFHAQIGPYVSPQSWLATNGLVKHATLMVDFFFVLSGFVIALNYADRIQCFRDVIKFQARRFWRLYPLHLTMLLVFAGIELVKLTGIGTDAGGSSASGIEEFINNLFLTQSWYLDHLSFNYPSWSISTEFYTYLIFAMVVLLSRGWLTVAALAVAVAAGTLLHLNGGLTTEAPWLIPRCIYSFFIGVLVWKASTLNGLPFLPAPPLLLASVAAVIWLDRDHFIMVPWLFGLTVLALARHRQGLTYRLLSAPWLVFLGTISYSLYMTHAAVWYVFKTLVRLTHVQLTPATETLLLLAGLALLVGVSTLTYRFVEDRFRVGIKRQSPQER
jgi:peptidoglycan/LPS O-acetylase OafA/YrhL